MATGYLVTLGDGSLDTGDSISGSQSTFTASSTIGTGSWTWTGVWDGDGQTYSNIPDTGTYFLGTDGNVYFTPKRGIQQAARRMSMPTLHIHLQTGLSRAPLVRT